MAPGQVIAATRAVIAGLGLTLAVWVGWGSPAWWAPPALAVAILVTSRASVRIVFGRQAAAFELCDAVLAVALVFLPGAWVPIGFTCGYVLAKIRRLPWTKLSFNAVLQFWTSALAVAVTVLAVRAFLRTLPTHPTSS